VLDRERALLLLLVAAAADGQRDRKPRAGLVSRLAARATGKVTEIVDPDTVLSKVDVDALMERVDVNALLDRVDMNTLLDRIDVNALLDRIDVDRLLARADVDALLERVDLEGAVRRSGIPDIVKESTGLLAESALDVVRRTLVALDVIVGNAFYRLTARKPQDRPAAPPKLESPPEESATGAGRVTGHYAGPVTRLVAFILDALILWLLFVLVGLGVKYIEDLFTTITPPGSVARGVIGLTIFGLCLFLYFWLGLAIAGKTIGMSIVGLAVVGRQGDALSGGAAFVRVLVFPVSLAFLGLGFVGILVGKRRRALHDVAARSAVVYDWGDRPAEMPAPLTRWLDRHDTAQAGQSPGGPPESD
jgi:uncharacterized RDD family membrane protein YckC